MSPSESLFTKHRVAATLFWLAIAFILFSISRCRADEDFLRLSYTRTALAPLPFGDGTPSVELLGEPNAPPKATLVQEDGLVTQLARVLEVTLSGIGAWMRDNWFWTALLAFNGHGVMSKAGVYGFIARMVRAFSMSMKAMREMERQSNNFVSTRKRAKRKPQNNNQQTKI